MRQPSRAFTLIETLAVITLLAVITAAVAVSLKGAARAASLDDVVGRFIACDRDTPELAPLFAQRVALRFDLNRGTVSRSRGEERATSLALGGGGDVRVVRLVVR